MAQQKKISELFPKKVQSIVEMENNPSNVDIIIDQSCRDKSLANKAKPPKLSRIASIRTEREPTYPDIFDISDYQSYSVKLQLLRATWDAANKYDFPIRFVVFLCILFNRS